MLRWSAQVGAAGRYGLAVLGIALVAARRSALFSAEAPWFLLEGATLVVAMLLGGGAALLATALSAIAAAFAISTRLPLPVLTPTQWTASAIFVAVTLALVGLIELLRSTASRPSTSPTFA